VSPRVDRAWAVWLLIALSLIPCVAAIWSVDYIPMLDGPKSAYAAHVRAHLSEPWYSSHFSATRPVTGFGFGLVFAAFEKVAPWRDALRIALSLIVIGWAVACASLARALHASRWPLAIAVLGAAIQWPLLMGFVNYVSSAALGIAAVAIGLAKTDWSIRRELGIAALLILGCAFHPFGPQCAGVVLGIALLSSTPAKLWLRRLGALFLMLTPAILITVVTSEQIRESRFEIAMGGGPQNVFLPWAQRLENFGLCFAGGPAWRAWPLVLLAIAGVGWALFVVVRRRRGRGAELALVAFVVLMAGLAVGMPFHGDAWQFFSPRFVPMAVIGGLMLVPVEALGRRAYITFAGLAILYNISANAWMAGSLRDLRARSAEGLAALGRPAAKGRTLLPIVYDTTGTGDALRAPRSLQPPYVEPLLNIGDIYGMDRDAVAAYSFSASAISCCHLITQRSTFPRVPAQDYRYMLATMPPGAERAYEVARIGTYGARFDDIVMVGSEVDADYLIASGYEVEFRQGRLLIARFRGCPATLRIEGAPEAGTVFVATGWGPYDRQGWSSTLPARSSKVVELERTPCGDTWVKVSPSEGGARCDGADENGVMRVRLPRSEPIECRLRAVGRVEAGR